LLVAGKDPFAGRIDVLTRGVLHVHLVIAGWQSSQMKRAIRAGNAAIFFAVANAHIDNLRIDDRFTVYNLALDFARSRALHWGRE